MRPKGKLTHTRNIHFKLKNSGFELQKEGFLVGGGYRSVFKKNRLEAITTTKLSENMRTIHFRVDGISDNIYFPTWAKLFQFEDLLNWKPKEVTN